MKRPRQEPEPEPPAEPPVVPWIFPDFDAPDAPVVVEPVVVEPVVAPVVVEPVDDPEYEFEFARSGDHTIFPLPRFGLQREAVLEALKNLPPNEWQRLQRVPDVPRWRCPKQFMQELATGFFDEIMNLPALKDFVRFESGGVPYRYKCDTASPGMWEHNVQHWAVWGAIAGRGPLVIVRSVVAVNAD